MSKLTRRSFLRGACAGVCGSLIHQSIFPDGGMMAYAMPPVIGALGQSPIMVVINFAGGADLNAMSPLYGGWYKDLNPTLAYTAANSRPLSADQGLHPAVSYDPTQNDPNGGILWKLWNEKSFSIVNMVGMGDSSGPKYTRAHDLDTEIKLSGYLSQASTYGGWAPRLTAQMSSALGGVSLSDQALVIQGDSNPPRAITSIDGGSDPFGSEWFSQTRDNAVLQNDAPTNPKYKSVLDASVAFAAAQKTLANLATVTLPATFPTSGLGNNLKDVARIINGNLGAQFFFVQQGGYDTHSGAKQSVTNNLTEVNGALSAFVTCAKAQGWWNRVIVLTLSEFGRTMENGNQGNDHGFSNAMWVLGGGINGGRIIAPPPVQSDLAGGSYVKNYWVDFRAVFKEAISAMGYNANLVFPSPIPNSTYTPTGIFS